MDIDTAVGEIRTHYLNLPEDDLTEGGRFTAEVLEKLVATEREKVLSEVEEWLVDESEEVGFDCDDPDCECHQEEPIDFDGAIIRNRLRAELRAKLNQLKGE